MLMQRPLIFLLLGLALLACKSASVKDAEGLFIRDRGRFTLADGNVLEVGEPREGGMALTFRLLDAQGKVLIKAPQSWATYTRWGMYYANGPRELWLSSGEIGHHHWRRMTNGAYIRCQDPQCKVNHTPAAFAKRLPPEALAVHTPRPESDAGPRI